MKKLCVGVLCLLMAAGLWGCEQRPSEEPAEEVFTEAITKIDLSAPESQKYRDWLDKFYAIPYSEEPVPEQTGVEPPSTIPKSNRPNINEAKKDSYWYEMLSQSIEEGFSSEGAAEENWKTWGWNDDWELEAYEYKKNYLGWEVLRARNKTTDETRFIHEVFNDASGDNGWSNFRIAKIDESYIVYCIDDWMFSTRYFFFALGQEKPCFIGFAEKSGYLDETQAIWWYVDYAPWGYENYNESAEYIYSLRYADLQKMAAGEKDAERIMFGNDEDWTLRQVWLTERGGHDIVYFYFSQITSIPIGPGGTQYEYGPHYIGAYDPLTDSTSDFFELPFIEINSAYLSDPISPSGIHYYFDGQQAYPYFKNGEEIDLSAIDFYIINLDI